MPAPLNRAEAERLVHSYSDLILRLSYTYLKSTDDAQDICQTVFLKLLQKPREFASPEHEKAWLIVTARNECKNQLRHWWRARREGPEVLEQLSYDPPSEEGEHLRELIWELPEKYRLALYLHYYQGYTAQEIGDLLGRSPSTVRTWLVQGREKLKSRLEAEGYEHP